MERRGIHLAVTLPRRLQVTERGHSEIDAQDWEALREQPAFWHLVESKIISVSQTRFGGARLTGGSHVGRAILGDVQLEITEKTPGCLSALVGFGTRGAFKVEKVGGPLTDVGPLVALVIHEFLESVRTYLSKGRERQFRTRRSVGSLVGGRLDMVRTLSLRARGARHLAAFVQDQLTFGTPKNKIIVTVLREIDRLSRIFDLDTDDVAKARSYGILFSDCVDVDVLTREIPFFSAMAERLLSDPRPEPEEDLLNLAGVLLSRSSVEDSGPDRGSGPRTWFINLETLFEKAVRASLGGAAVGLEVKRGLDFEGRFLFPDSFRAGPDLVLSRAGDIVAVGDAKYKMTSLLPGKDEGLAEFHPDVYQLISHAAAFGTPNAFLVFPGDVYSQTSLGTSATGCDVRVFTVSLTDILGDCGKLLSAAGLGPVAALVNF